MSGKRFILLLACSLLCTAAIAGSGRFPRGLHAGAGYSNHLESIKMKYEDAGKHFLSGNFHGAYASLGYEFHFEENMPLFLDVSLGFRRAWGSLHDMDEESDRKRVFDCVAGRFRPAPEDIKNIPQRLECVKGDPDRGCD